MITVYDKKGKKCICELSQLNQLLSKGFTKTPLSDKQPGDKQPGDEQPGDEQLNSEVKGKEDSKTEKIRKNPNKNK